MYFHNLQSNSFWYFHHSNDHTILCSWSAYVWNCPFAKWASPNSQLVFLQCHSLLPSNLVYPSISTRNIALVKGLELSRRMIEWFFLFLLLPSAELKKEWMELFIEYSSMSRNAEQITALSNKSLYYIGTTSREISTNVVRGMINFFNLLLNLFMNCLSWLYIIKY